MRLLIIAAVAAITSVVAVFALKSIDGPWGDDSSIRTAIAGAASGVVSVGVARKLRRES